MTRREAGRKQAHKDYVQGTCHMDTASVLRMMNKKTGQNWNQVRILKGEQRKAMTEYSFGYDEVLEHYRQEAREAKR